MTKPKITDYFSAEFLKFLICNGFAAGVNFCSRILINYFTGYLFSVIIAYGFGMLTAFSLNKFFVFKGSGHNTSRQFTGFFIVNMIALIQTVFFSILFKTYIFPYLGFSFYPDEIAHFIGLSIPIFSSYLGHKYFSFGQKEE